MNRSVGLACFAAILAFALPAHAHTGHGAEGFVAGLAHPVFGPDHLLAMLAVGLWAGLIGGPSLWVWPASFVAAMLAGGVLGLGGIELPVVELVTVGSVVALGAAVALDFRPHVALGAAAIAVFGLAHGNAHGLEAPADASGIAYAIGFLLATAALHGVGLGLAALTRRDYAARLTRALGALLALAGLALFAG